jgi:hypothetical protein
LTAASPSAWCRSPSGWTPRSSRRRTDSPNLLSWDAAASDADNAARFLAPVKLYRPGTLMNLTRNIDERHPDGFLDGIAEGRNVDGRARSYLVAQTRQLGKLGIGCWMGGGAWASGLASS